MRIALVDSAQHDSLADLLCELYAYYNDGAEVSRETVLSHLRQNLLVAESPVRLVVASRPDQSVAGFAAIVLLHSLVDPRPAHSRQCLVKELFVRSSERGNGVGKTLMAWVARYAIEHRCGRIDWNVKASNNAGIAFYERLGAEQVVERLSYRLSRSSMETLAHEDGV